MQVLAQVNMIKPREYVKRIDLDYCECEYDSRQINIQNKMEYIDCIYYSRRIKVSTFLRKIFTDLVL
jgi:hypothetical protein